MGAFVQRSLISAFALAGQFVVPFICLLGAVVSVLKRQKRKALRAEVTHSASADVLNGMNWHEFEMLVGEAFRLQGYTVSETGAAGPDGGVDLVLRKGSEVFLVQCKQWKAYKVTVEIVRELYGVMAARGAAGGFVVTSGTFTADAHAFAQGRNVKLVDGAKLHGLLQQARASARRSGRTPTPSAKEVSIPVAAVPSCPVCKSSMVRRKARKGANAGSEFWGCPQYPACRGTR
jgi:restriction system protein